jgi:hypothetical protein
LELCAEVSVKESDEMDHVQAMLLIDRRESRYKAISVRFVRMIS